MNNLIDLYLSQFKVSLAEAIQYRVGIAMQFLGKMAEPIIYLVVWTTIARQSGGSVGGFTENDFIVYFIAWTFVRQITVAWDPFWMEWRIRRGDFTPLLLRPVHPFLTDTVLILSFKTVELFIVIPTIVTLVLIFRPEFHFVGWSSVAFIPALALAFALRYTLAYAMALSAFWTTRVTALFRLFFAVEFFVSGRIAPLSVLPDWGQQIAAALPFRWMFYFPLEVLLGRLGPVEVLSGFAAQSVWLAVCAAALLLIWPAAVRRYTAVGG
jgi:ABC-2 type transport system permease protein